MKDKILDALNDYILALDSIWHHSYSGSEMRDCRSKQEEIRNLIQEIEASNAL